MQDNGDNKKKAAERSGILHALGLFTQLGLSMSLCVIGGVLAGRLLDRWLGTEPWLVVLFAFLGAGAAMKIMFDIAKNWK